MAHQESSVDEGERESDTEDDPLDAFMAGIEVQYILGRDGMSLV